jgi:hypothetical protein
VARKPAQWRIAAAVLIIATAGLARADIEDCNLEAIDMVTETAVARCDEAISLLSLGDTFQNLSVVDITARQLTLAGESGTTVLWSLAQGGERSRVRRIVDHNDAAADREIPETLINERAGEVRLEKSQP